MTSPTSAPPPSPDQWIAEAKARCDAATLGPWTREDDWKVVSMSTVSGMSISVLMGLAGGICLWNLLVLHGGDANVCSRASVAFGFAIAAAGWLATGLTYWPKP